MLNINNTHVQRVGQIWSELGHTVTLPGPDEWRQKSEDDIWLRVVSQVVVAGKSSPADKLALPDIKRRLAWRRISTMDRKDAIQEIWSVLKEIGTRWAGKSPETCRKTKALFYNLEFLKGFPGGPRSWIEEIAKLPSSESKILSVSDSFKYVSNKGARDFLISGFGLVQDHIALDVRVLDALSHIGIKDLPKDTPSDAKIYRSIEKDIIEHICKPLNISAAELDQLLYKNKDQIKKIAFAALIPANVSA